MYSLFYSIDPKICARFKKSWFRIYEIKHHKKNVIMYLFNMNDLLHFLEIILPTKIYHKYCKLLIRLEFKIFKF